MSKKLKKICLVTALIPIGLGYVLNFGGQLLAAGNNFFKGECECLEHGEPVDSNIDLDVGAALAQLHRAVPTGEYYWPNGNGRRGQDGASPYHGPKDLNGSLSWSWHHPEGRYHTLLYGVLIDENKHIYLTTDTSIWKFTAKGETLWSFYPTPRATIFSAASLLDGRMHFTTLDGRIWAISMDAGRVLWSRKVCDSINHDNGYVTSSEGVVVAATDARGDGAARANRKVLAVNATDGGTLWSFTPEAPVWNLLASFPGDGTVLYQDFNGRGYRHKLSDGEVIWKAGGMPETWTDGSGLLGPNGIFYTVTGRNRKVFDWSSCPASAGGFLHALRISDGRLLWKACTPLPLHGKAAIGRLPGHAGLSVVQPGGMMGWRGAPSKVWAFDAQTGRRQWSFTAPSQKGLLQAGVAEGHQERMSQGATAGYVTTPFSAATMDVGGIVYLGHMDGLLFTLQDSNGDGRVDGEGEVTTFQTGAAFASSISPAIAPGMLVIANCDTMYVFEAPNA